MSESIMVSKADILKTSIVAAEALQFMAKKAGVSPLVILQTITEDPNGNAARYFKDLTTPVMAEVIK